MVLTAILLGASVSRGQILWITSSAQQQWKEMPSSAVGLSDRSQQADVHADPAKQFQSIDGFGGCFNELGWVALSKATSQDRQLVLHALFDKTGCALNLGRIPIGASDFALDGYSLDDTPGDLNLNHFSIDRDKRHLLPYLKSALSIRPQLRFWASPWSPPAWMKTNNKYSGGELAWKPEVLESYAAYLARWVKEYRSAGINIYAITPQNEPNITNVYPTCLWTGDHLREFIASYLGPKLKAQKPAVELWLGLNGDPINGGENPDDRLRSVLEDPAANSYLKGIAFQYDSKNQIKHASLRYPNKKLMQSETECNGGGNSWGDAERLFGLMKRYFDGGANAYFMWNMVLNESGKSTWNWPQNAMVTVNSQTGKVTFNGEYYVLRHFSQFIKPGARRILTSGNIEHVIAFKNPDKSTVLLLCNPADGEPTLKLVLEDSKAGKSINVKLPPHSVNTLLIK